MNVFFLFKFYVDLWLQNPETVYAKTFITYLHLIIKQKYNINFLNFFS